MMENVKQFAADTGVVVGSAAVVAAVALAPVVYVAAFCCGAGIAVGAAAKPKKEENQGCHIQ